MGHLSRCFRRLSPIFSFATVSHAFFRLCAPAIDALVEKKSRNSRWSRDPVRGPDGSAVAVYPTERDIEIFKLLARYRYLPSDYIHAFVGGNPKALLHRLNLLSRKPNVYLARPPQQR